MLILIPVDGSDEQSSKITTLASIKKWALVDFDQGLVQSVTLHDDRTQEIIEAFKFKELDEVGF